MNLNQSVVLSASGRAMFGVGGTASHATHEYKGYIVSLEWDETDGEPVLLLWTGMGGRDAGVFGICLSSAGKYADPSGGLSEGALEHLALALPTLGRAMLPIELHVLADVVLRYIAELLAMPPAPRSIRMAAKGEAIMDITQKDYRDRVISEVSL